MAIRIVYIIPPGRFPTVAYDPGQWIQKLNKNLIQAEAYSANEVFWRNIFGIKGVKRACSVLGLINFRHISWLTGFAKSARKAAQALESLRKTSTYRSSERYINTISILQKHLERFNSFQQECCIDFAGGIQVNGLNYSDTSEIMRYSRKDTFLSGLIKDTLGGMNSKTNLVLMQVYSHQELPTACILALELRKRIQGVHICLADHGYENFTLEPFMENLKNGSVLFEAFDTIIEKKHEKDEVIPLLIEDISRGKGVKGVISSKCFQPKPPDIEGFQPLGMIRAFTPRPVFWTRVGPVGCYWGKCAFCTQNTKHRGMDSVNSVDINSFLDRLPSLISSGYRDFILSDEALPPKLLEALSIGILERKLEFNWSCRARLETGFTSGRLQVIRQAGCYEILFGMESGSSRVLELMNKYPSYPGQDGIERILTDMDRGGIAAHINLIIGFPGEEISDAWESVRFLEKLIKKLPGATYTLNRFMLFGETAVFRSPDACGITISNPAGDIPGSYSFQYNTGPYSDERTLEKLINRLGTDLYEKTGLGRFGPAAESHTALYMYSMSAHGAIFKCEKENVFANPPGGP